jgi:hypothetical protein
MMSYSDVAFICFHLFTNGSTALCWALAAFSVSQSYTQSVGHLDGGSARRTAATCTEQHTQTSMPRVGFKPTIPVFELTKTVHAPDREANVTGDISIYISKTST